MMIWMIIGPRRVLMVMRLPRMGKERISLLLKRLLRNLRHILYISFS